MLSTDRKIASATGKSTRRGLESGYIPTCTCDEDGCPDRDPRSSMRSLERVIETQISLLELERSPEESREDCQLCRSLDCDIIFALLFTIVIGCLLALILVFWLGGVFKYKE